MVLNFKEQKREAQKIHKVQRRISTTKIIANELKISITQNPKLSMMMIM